MNPTIKKGIQEIWEKASDKFRKQFKSKKPIDIMSARELLVNQDKLGNPWGTPIQEIVDVVVDDIEGMPWSGDARDEVALSIDGYFKELRKQARAEFFKNYKYTSDPDF